MKSHSDLCYRRWRGVRSLETDKIMCGCRGRKGCYPELGGLVSAPHTNGARLIVGQQEHSQFAGSHPPSPVRQVCARFPRKRQPRPGLPARSWSPYNCRVADRIVCSCVTCPSCGAWVVVQGRTTGGTNKDRFSTTCPVPECGKEFVFEGSETRVFELPVSLFERRHFYRSELQ